MTKEVIKPCDVASIHARYLDCCLPCYFQGSDAEEVLAIPIWKEMTYREAYEAAKEEFHAQDGYFSDIENCGEMAETALHSLFASMLAEDTDEPADFAQYAPSIDDDEQDESVYLYIGLFAETE